MRGRRRHLVGFSVAVVVLLAAAPALASASPQLADAVPSLASPSQKPFIAPQPRPTEARQRPTDDPDPNRNAYTVPRGAALARLRPSTSASTGWPRGSTPRACSTRNGDGVPDFVEQVLEVAEHVARDREREARLARAAGATARLGGGNGKTDIYLSQIGGSLFGYAAPDRGQISKTRRIPRRLHGYLVLDNDYSAFEFPGTKPARRPRGDARPRVQPHPPVRLRRLPGPLVRRVDRDLDGGPGLQRHRRLPALRAPLGAAAGTRR